MWQEAFAEVYRDRILRGTENDGFYSWRKLRAFGANLGALACLFIEPWRRPAPALSESDQAWLLNETAIQLRALGRLAEALEPMQAGAELYVKREEWENAALVFSNLSELQLGLGRVRKAVADARRSVEHADRSGNAATCILTRTTLADTLHQQGETGEALAAFAEAERMQAQWQPQYPLLYSLRGFLYCNLLLAEAERAAWSRQGGLGEGGPWEGVGEAGADPGRAAACDEVARRAGQALKIAEDNSLSLLTIALDHLTLARCALYQDRLQGRPPGPEARDQTERALDRLRAAGRQDYTPPSASSPGPGCATPWATPTPPAPT